ncbi:hypothetical protein V6N13_109603 [Hibiscus sabdariffa]
MVFMFANSFLTRAEISGTRRAQVLGFLVKKLEKFTLLHKTFSGLALKLQQVPRLDIVPTSLAISLQLF